MVGIVINRLWVLCCATMALTIFVPIVRTQQPLAGGEAALNSTEINHRNADYEYEYDAEWPRLNRTLGSVSAVAFDPSGNVVIFHRGRHVWNLLSFDQQNRYLQEKDGPIGESTLLIFHNESGALVGEWGANLFFMPHGLTIDRNNSYWITDVALHQVFKFDLTVSSTKPAMTLGVRFEPGKDHEHFCKPTSVAVLENGDFFVADGYCNGRVNKYSADGRLILSWGKNSFVLTRTFMLPAGPIPVNFFAIPHALTYAADKKLICVADREQGRVQCFNANNGVFHSMYESPRIGSRLFSVKYIPRDGGLLYVVNGPQFTTAEPVNGLVMSMTSKEIVGRFFPEHAFSNPHELAVSGDGAQVYVAELNPHKVHKFKRKSGLPEIPTPILDPAESKVETFPPSDQPVLYTGALTTIPIVVSLVGIGCMVVCLFRTFCVKSRGGRRQRFSTPSENISLREMGEDREA